MAKNTYPWDLIKKLTPQEYREALFDLDDERPITDNQRRMLCIHCEAPRCTMTTKQLARAVGLAGHQAVNSVYGYLARRLWEKFRLPPPGKVVSPEGKWIGVLGSGDIIRGHEWKMTMRPPLAKALKQLKQKGWCSRRQGRK